MLTFIISGCMKLNTTDLVNNDISETDFSGSESYLPSFKELSGRKFNNDELIVGYQNDANLDEILKNFKGATVEKEIPELKAVLLKLDTNVMDVEKAFEILKGKKIEGIRYVEPNYTDREIPVIKSTDSKTQKEMGSSTLNQVEEGYPDYKDKQYALKKIGAESAWEKATGEGVIVGLLDTGTDGTHPDLVDQLVEGYDPYLGVTIDPAIDYDSDGHGTHTAGIIAAKDDGQGVVGLAPDAKIMPIRIFNPGYIGDYAVADGIVWAVDHGADVLSNSWGGGGYSNILKDAFDYALTNDVVVVASSGNDTTDQFWHYPSAFTGVIGVAASDALDEITDFSSRGEYVSVAAPGNNVISSIPVRLAVSDGVVGEPFAYWAGTSMACPYVSALAALIKEEYPDANVYQIRKMIEEGAVDIDEDGYDTSAGYGRISSASLDLNPADYEAGNLVVKAISKRSSNPLPGVFITLESKETSKRYYGKTSNDGTELFAGIEPGDYEIIIGGPEYLYYFAPNYRMEEELSYSGVVEVSNVTTYTQEFETTQFKTDLTTDLSFAGTLTISLLDSYETPIKTFEFTSNAEISIDLLPDIDESGHYYLAYEYVGTIPEEEFGIRGEIQINNESIPVEIPVNQEGTGFIDEYGGLGIPWTIF
ncbi:subtilase family protein [Petrotoga olearia]|uniref:Subtilase family protein n=2 Tax=Petrotoga olearia TaxID=156203 RepID=A0ABX9UEJ7_9BACT|nr:subtilase family protein [Petrotoga olearia]